MTHYTAEPGDSIHRAAQKAIALAAKEGNEVQLKFNDVVIIVSPFSFDCDIALIYSLKHKLAQR
jgi:hypothetical protein